MSLHLGGINSAACRIKGARDTSGISTQIITVCFTGSRRGDVPDSHACSLVVVTAGGWDRRRDEIKAQHNVYLMTQRL
jgi:hypothetical protein